RTRTSHTVRRSRRDDHCHTCDHDGSVLPHGAEHRCVAGRAVIDVLVDTPPEVGGHWHERIAWSCVRCGRDSSPACAGTSLERTKADLVWSPRLGGITPNGA